MSFDGNNNSNQQKPISLYELLPALYRIRDSEHGGKLEALADIISDQANIIHCDIAGLWDDLFIETCRPWIIPYIADLVGNNPLYGVVSSMRADVAKTIRYRRRKGTRSMLEEMTRDVTGWDAHVRPFFELLGWTQNLNHLRYQVATKNETGQGREEDPYSVNRVGSVNLRDMEALDHLDGPHDIISHSVDVRNISNLNGWYGIKKIGFFLWRLISYPLGIVEDEIIDDVGELNRKLIDARRSESCSDGYYFSPLGNPMPLFVSPGGNEDNACQRQNRLMTGPLRPLAFRLRKADYYGPDKSLCIFNDGKQVDEAAIIYQDLSDWDSITPLHFEGIDAAVDVSSGRILFLNQTRLKNVKVCYCYGFSSDMGGGPYERRDSLSIVDESYAESNQEIKKIFVSRNTTAKCRYGTIQGAIDYWRNHEDDESRFIITILDNATYDEEISLELPGKRRLAIRADNGKRPHIKLKGDEGILYIEGDTDSGLTLDGLLIEGAIHVKGNLNNLNIIHCTLVPGLGTKENGEPKSLDKPSIKVDSDCVNLHLLIDHSIAGALCLPSKMMDFTARDCIVDGEINGDVNEDSVKPPGVLVSGELLPFPTITSSSPEVNVTIDKEGPFLAKFKYRITADFEEARSQLQAAIREAYCSLAFGETNVEVINNRLIVKPGAGGFIDIKPSENDETTARELKLDKESATYVSDLQSMALMEQIRSSNASGATDIFGPATILERVTILGKVHVKEMRMATDVIFADIVHSDRQQAGWIRFSYVPENSITPRRYRCQPDLALDAENLLRGKLNAKETDAVYTRVAPSFTSIRYGNPAYAQLSPDCAKEIRTGAEDGSEMGAFCSLKQPQREANLRIRLDEYLPFGLEAGIIYIT